MWNSTKLKYIKGRINNMKQKKMKNFCYSKFLIHDQHLSICSCDYSNNFRKQKCIYKDSSMLTLNCGNIQKFNILYMASTAVAIFWLLDFHKKKKWNTQNINLLTHPIKLMIVKKKIVCSEIPNKILHPNIYLREHI